MRIINLAMALLEVSALLFVKSAWAYGPFVLPIHNNSVQISGGAWNYSLNCSAAAYEAANPPFSSSHGGFDFDGDEGDNVYAAASGIVSDMKNSDCPNTCKSGGWGCYVDIDHDVDGDGTSDYTTPTPG